MRRLVRAVQGKGIGSVLHLYPGEGLALLRCLDAPTLDEAASLALIADHRAPAAPAPRRQHTSHSHERAPSRFDRGFVCYSCERDELPDWLRQHALVP